MFKNKLLRTALALLIAFSMTVPSFVLHAEAGDSVSLASEEKDKAIVLKEGIRKTGTEIVFLFLGSIAEAKKVNEVKIDGTDVDSVDSFDELKKGDKTKWYLTNKPEAKPEHKRAIIIHPLKKGNSVELITEDGVLSFTIEEFDRTDRVHFGSVKFTPKESEVPSLPDPPQPQPEPQPPQPPQPEPQPQPKELVIKLSENQEMFNPDFIILATDEKGEALDLTGKIKELKVNESIYTLGTSKHVAFTPANDYFIEKNKIYIERLEEGANVTLVDKNEKAHKYKYSRAGKSFTELVEPPVPPQPQPQPEPQPEPEHSRIYLNPHLASNAFDYFYLEAKEIKGGKLVPLKLSGKIKKLMIGKQEYTLGTHKNVFWNPEKDYYVEQDKLYIDPLKDKDVLTLVDSKNKTHYYQYNRANNTLDYSETELVNHFKIRLKGSFEAAMLNQKGYDAISGATTGGSVNNQNSDVLVQYTEKENPAEEDWINLSKDNENPNLNNIKIVIEDEKGMPVDCGMKGMFSNIDSKLTLSGTPNKVGKFKIQFVLNRDGEKIESNKLPFHVYGLDETLSDHYKMENAKPFPHGGKYYWDMKPWYITKFGGENETVTAPKEIKAIFGSKVSGTYGVLGYPIKEGQNPTQTLIVGDETDLTLVNMKLLSSVQIIVKKGGKLNLMDSSLHGVIEVEDGGTLQVNYDSHKNIFTKGSSINGQIELKEGAILKDSLIYSNTNYLPNGNGSDGVEPARHNVNPVILVTGDARIEGKVFVRGDEAPTGIDPETGEIYTGQPAIVLDANVKLHVPKGSILGAYGGGWTHLTSHGGAALILEEGSAVEGEGSLIAMPGASTTGEGSFAVEGEGTLAVKQLYIHGGNTLGTIGGKPLAETVKVDKSVAPIGKLFDGKSKTEMTSNMEYDDPYFWYSTVDAPKYEFLKSETNPIFEEEPASQVPVEFSITVQTDHNGTASADKASAVEGTEITLNAKPNEGYRFKTWEVVSPKGLLITEGKFKMPGENVIVKAIFEKEVAAPNPENPGKPNPQNPQEPKPENPQHPSQPDSADTGNTGGSSGGDSGGTSSSGGSSSGGVASTKPAKDDKTAKKGLETIQDGKTPLGDIEGESAFESLTQEEKEAIREMMKGSDEDKALIKDYLTRKISGSSFVAKISEDSLTRYGEHLAKIFKDVSASDWYAKELSALYMTQFIKGYEDGTFRPNNLITGKEFVTILVRAGEWEIKVVEGDWSAPYIQAARDKGLLENIEIDLSKALTREEIAALSYNFIRVQTGESLEAKQEMNFVDKDKIDASTAKQIAALVDKGILKGYPDGSFGPEKNVKRSEIVSVVYRLLRTK